MSMLKIRVTYLILILFALVSTVHAEGKIKRYNCGKVTNRGGQILSVEILKVEEKLIVSVSLANGRTSSRAGYNLNPDGWEHLIKAYEKAWSVKKEGEVGGIKAPEVNSGKTQSLAVIAAPGKGVLMLGEGPKGRVGVAISPGEKADMDKLVKKYGQHMALLRGKK